jgi:hypothetical protein
MAKDHDIKAPDGFLLGGIRRVRKDGTILFQRGYWELPEADKERFIGEDVWCHIYDAKAERKTVLAERNTKPDAKPALRKRTLRDYSQRKMDHVACERCGGETRLFGLSCGITFSA